MMLACPIPAPQKIPGNVDDDIVAALRKANGLFPESVIGAFAYYVLHM